MGGDRLPGGLRKSHDDLQERIRKHDEKRFNQYLSKALDGKEKIHAETLYPYDLVEKVLYGRQWNQVLEAQWRQLPDYVAQETNAIVIADVSGS